MEYYAMRILGYQEWNIGDENIRVPGMEYYAMRILGSQEWNIGDENIRVPGREYYAMRILGFQEWHSQDVMKPTVSCLKGKCIISIKVHTCNLQ